MDERGAGVKHLTNIFRRLHRIFAHAWFQHRGVFWQVEGQTGLYVLFKTVCDTYDLLPAENYKLPPEAEGLEPAEEHRAPVPSIMKAVPTPSNIFLTDDDSSRKNTRRHIRQSPSVGSAVTTVLESDEEEVDVTRKLGDLQIAEEDEEEGETEIPVIVESYEVDESQKTEEEPVSAPAEEVEQISDAPAESISSTSSWDSMSSELEEKSEPRPQTPEEDKPEQEPVAETSDEAQGEALISMVAEQDEKPAPEKSFVEEVSGKQELNEEGEKVTENATLKVAEKADDEKKVEDS